MRLLPVAAALACAAAAAPPLHAQDGRVAGDELIATVRSNGVRHGEFMLLRRPDGDFWIAADDLAALRIAPQEAARRINAGRTFYSVRSLGAQRVEFDEAQLALDIDFRPQVLQGTVLDLSTRRGPAVPSTPGKSLILAYHLALQNGFDGQPARARLDSEANVRLGPLLLRQELRLDTSAQRRTLRGVTQAIVDDPANARRWMAGDVLSSAGNYGTTITGAGLLLRKLYDLTPDVIRQPAATLHVTAMQPSQVEVAVDGNTLYRTNVGPGPITLDNLALHGGTQTVRVTVTDASGRVQVIEQPFLFTDAALAKGLHDYSYFVGRRSELGAGGSWVYREPAWQAFHRYGLSDSLTVGAGGEGSARFASGGGGITWRSDRVGLVSADLLASTDRDAHRTARGWSLRYQYLLPTASFIAARRRFGDGFRTFAGNALFLKEETRVGAARSFGTFSVSGELVRSERVGERRQGGLLRAGFRLNRQLTVGADVQRTRVNGELQWSANVFLRADLEDLRWFSSTLRADQDSRGIDLEAGRPVPPGEGVGYRAGLSTTSGHDARSYGYAAADWNLRHASLDMYVSAPVRGNAPAYAQLGVSGALVAVADYWGVTRRVPDSFAVASLGVPQAGVDVMLNNQVLGTTDADGMAFIPQVGSFGRQDVAINDRQLDLQYAIPRKLRTIVPAYRSGTLVDFGGHRLRAIAGTAWTLRSGLRRRVALREWTMTQDGGGAITVRTGRDGDFYLEDVVPGLYRGSLRDEQGTHACVLRIPAFDEPVFESKEGIACD